MMPPRSQPLSAGETVRRTVRYTRADIAEFARLTGDANPVHHDLQAAHRARHGEIIASGQQSASQLMGLAASYFSRSDDGCAREMLALNFNFAFKAPVFAEQSIVLQWSVSTVAWSSSLEGWIGHIDGHASVGGRRCVVARGTILVRGGTEGRA
jgi:acyl dehydratase